MLNELAHFSLNIALGFAVLGTIIPLLGATLRRSSWMQLASVFALLQFLLVCFCLWSAHARLCDIGFLFAFGGAQLPYTQADDL